MVDFLYSIGVHIYIDSAFWSFTRIMRKRSIRLHKNTCCFCRWPRAASITMGRNFTYIRGLRLIQHPISQKKGWIQDEWKVVIIQSYRQALK
ncbi:hypothetical protein BDR04DRAFT_769106 [Suillus decipiens]|nr:hypothetical protein BDR04DRAFT_769106 [Suillus decipiens]